MFAPLEYSDKDAAALHATGTWSETQYGEVHIQWGTLDELRNGDADPPITIKEVHYCCGKALGRPMKMPVSKDTNSDGVPVTTSLTINDYLKHSCVFEPAGPYYGSDFGYQTL